MKSNVSGNPLDNDLLEHGVLTYSCDGGSTVRIRVDEIAVVAFDDKERKTIIITAGGARLYLDGLDSDVVAARWLDALKIEHELQKMDRLRGIGVN